MSGFHLRYLWYLAVGASSRPALRLGARWWDADYARGGLARTEGDIELPRHLLVASLARHYAPGGRILDIGCGSGGGVMPLRESFGSALHYVGLDFSEAALRLAERRREEPGNEVLGAGALSFVHADFDSYEPEPGYDAIVFSESLYYATDPLATVQRYAKALSPGGVIIVSMWRRGSRRSVWRKLGTAFQECSRSRLVVPLRPAWDIVVYSKS